MKDRRRPPREEEVEITINEGVGRDQLAHLLRALRALRAQGEHIMSQLDDLNASQAATSARVDEVDAQVRKLIAGGTATDLTGAIAAEQAIKAKLDAIPAA